MAFEYRKRVFGNGRLRQERPAGARRWMRVPNLALSLRGAEKILVRLEFVRQRQSEKEHTYVKGLAGSGASRSCFVQLR